MFYFTKYGHSKTILIVVTHIIVRKFLKRDYD